jgi:hypothetical protein
LLIQLDFPRLATISELVIVHGALSLVMAVGTPRQRASNRYFE